MLKMKKLINCNGTLVDFSTPKVMGILNLAPDSFYDGGKFNNEKQILDHAGQMIRQGAAIIDLGAQSTRPNASRISEDDEWLRLQDPLKKIRKNFPSMILSIDTFHSGIATRALDEGADLINDISGGTMDENMFSVIAKYKVPYVLTHIQKTPQTMQQNPLYENVTKELIQSFSERVQQLVSSGVHDIIIDPGFGFGKTTDHNYELLNNLGLFRILNRPILAGISRKSMITKILNCTPDDALNGTTALNMVALMNGADILRVHDVKEAVETIQLTKALQVKQSLIS